MMINKSNSRIWEYVLCTAILSMLLLTITPIQSQPTQKINEAVSSDIITVDIAQEIASTFLIHHQKQAQFTIDSSEPLLDSDGSSTLAYVIHLQPDGYIVVSGSTLLSPIIAFSWLQPYPTQPFDTFTEFLSFDLTTQLSNTDCFSEDIISNRWNQWDLLLSQNGILCSLSEQWPPEGTTATGGWIETTWHQDSPYNDLCPIEPSSGTRSIAGCPAVAMAQIFNYHRTTNNIQFSDEDDYYHNYLNRYWIDNDHEKYDFPSFPQLNDYMDTVSQHFSQSQPLTDQDMAALNFACGVACKQVYSPGGSGTFGVNQAYKAYLRFNCSTVQLYTESTDDVYDIIIDDIKNARPVHLAVVTPAWNAGHNLIIDGYNTEGFFHLNFGWGGTYDTWYRLPTDLPFDLTVLEGVIVNILNYNTTEDLSCEGHIQWRDVAPGSEIQGSFTVSNIGEPGSVLSWKLLSVPEWGTWTITPDAGTGLTPEQGALSIDVNVVAPTKKNKEYSGGIIIVNTNNPGDREYIPIVLQTTKSARSIGYHWQSLFRFPVLTFLARNRF
ncbi:MAG: C10 family peptidase [Candidatus Thermoplasmatota archaeon]|nr:C10 family peptidase [Candidatus Thermoplasmatota archaeon]